MSNANFPQSTPSTMYRNGLFNLVSCDMHGPLPSWHIFPGSQKVTKVICLIFFVQLNTFRRDQISHGPILTVAN